MPRLRRMLSFARGAAECMVDDSGATAIEYGLLAALIVVVSLTALGGTSSSVSAMYQYFSNAISAAIQAAL